MAIKSKTQTPAKKLPAPKKKDLNPDDVDMEALEDDDDEEMESQPPKSSKKTKLAKDKSPAKEPKGKKENPPKEKQGKKSSKEEGPTTPTGKQTNGTAKSSNLELKAKESRTDRLERTVYVKHLKPTITDEDIVQFFARLGECAEIKRVRSKAMAMVLLDSAKTVEKAIGLSGKSINGQTIAVERSKFLGMKKVLNEKKKLRLKKRKLERRKTARPEAGEVGGKEPTTEATGKGQKKNKTSKKQDSTPNKLGKGKNVAKPSANNQKRKPTKPASEANGTNKKESKKGKKVTK